MNIEEIIAYILAVLASFSLIITCIVDAYTYKKLEKRVKKLEDNLNDLGLY